MRIEDEAALWKVVERMKAEKVSSFSIDGLSVQFSPEAFAQNTPSVMPDPEMTEEQKQKAAEEILYHSAG
jgi:hypothetical protein